MRDLITGLRWMRAIGDTIFAAGTVALVLFIFGLSKGYSYQRPAPSHVVTKPAHQTA
jgi:hypothetical protein